MEHKSKKQWIPAVIVFCLAILFFFVYQTSTESWDKQLATQQSQIHELENELALKKASKEQAQSQIVQSTTGLNKERVTKDDEIADAFLTQIMTWSSYEEYSAIRQTLLNEYQMSENDNFMKVFMPDVVTKTSPDGTVYNRIDVMGLNVTYEGMKSYVTGIKADVYTYFAFVDWSSSDKNGNEASTTCIFMYSIDSDGNVFDLDASTIAL